MIGKNAAGAAFVVLLALLCATTSFAGSPFSGTPVRVVDGTSPSVNSVGDIVVAYNGAIRLWRNGSTAPESIGWGGNTPRFSPDGNKIAWANSAGALFVYSLATRVVVGWGGSSVLPNSQVSWVDNDLFLAVENIGSTSNVQLFDATTFEVVSTIESWDTTFGVHEVEYIGGKKYFSAGTHGVVPQPGNGLLYDNLWSPYGFQVDSVTGFISKMRWFGDRLYYVRSDYGLPSIWGFDNEGPEYLMEGAGVDIIDGWAARSIGGKSYLYNCAVPEPTSMVALGAGLVGLVGLVRRRRTS